MDSTYSLIMKAVGFEKADKKTKKLGGSLGNLAKKAGAVAGAYFGSQAIISGLKSSMDLYARQEQAIRKLDQAMGKNTSGLQSYASQLQKTTRFGDEATLEQMAFLGSLGMTEAQIKKIIPVAMDLATATGMNLESAVRNTAKTFSGMAGELGELVPQLRGLTAEQMKSGEAVDIMAELFGGQAQSDAESYAGTIDQMKNALGDLGENVGSVLAPKIRDLASSLTNMISSDFSDSLQSESDKFKSLTDILINAESSTTSRKLAIDTLQKDYPKYIGNLDLEKSSYEDITKMQKASLEQMRKKIALAVFEEEMIDIGKRRVEAERELLEAEMMSAEVHATNSGNVIDSRQIAIDSAQRELDQIDIKNEKLNEEMEAYAEKYEIQIAGNETLIEQTQTLIDLNNELTEGELEAGETEADIVDSSIDNTKKKQNAVVDYFKDRRKNFQAMTKAEQAQALETAAIQAQTAKEGAISTIKAEAQSATASLIRSIFQNVSYPFNLILSATAGGAVNELVGSLTNNLAEGYDGVVTSPTLFRAGEQGAERIQVTNLTKDDGGIDSPSGGSGIVINAEVATEEFFDRVMDYMDNKQARNLA